MLNIDSRSVVVFDLDDTLYKEVDFLKSAYQYIAIHLEPQIGHNIYTEMWQLYRDGAVTFDVIKARYSFEQSIQELVHWYREHEPKIVLTDGTKQTLTTLKNKCLAVGLITDGRSSSQRNKIKALGLDGFFDKIIISEEFGSNKPNINNFQTFNLYYPIAQQFIYIGDNLKKDFIAPNQLGWLSFCLKDNGQNIHTQNISDCSDSQMPSFFIETLSDII